MTKWKIKGAMDSATFSLNLPLHIRKWSEAATKTEVLLVSFNNKNPKTFFDNGKMFFDFRWSLQAFVLSPCSTTASPTATSPATPFSSGPKVTARGCCPPTSFQPHLNVPQVFVKSRFVVALYAAGRREASADLFFSSACPWLPLLSLWFFQASTPVVWAATSMTRSPVPWPSPEPLASPSLTLVFSTPLNPQY